MERKAFDMFFWWKKSHEILFWKKKAIEFFLSPKCFYCGQIRLWGQCIQQMRLQRGKHKAESCFCTQPRTKILCWINFYRMQKCKNAYTIYFIIGCFARLSLFKPWGWHLKFHHENDISQNQLFSQKNLSTQRLQIIFLAKTLEINNLGINAILHFDDILHQLAFQCLHKTELFECLNVFAQNISTSSGFNQYLCFLSWKIHL